MHRLFLLLSAVLALASCTNKAAETSRGTIVVYSTIDTPVMQPLLAAFEDRNPGARVEYHSLTAAEVTDRYLTDRKLGRPGPDLLINSAMDLQVKLANDGEALSFSPQDAALLPDWAHWRNRAYAIAVEPIVIGYNKAALPDLPASLSRAQLTQYLQGRRAAFSGKVGLYDPADSSTGMLLINQDLEADPANWELIRTLGTLSPKLYRSSHDMIEDVSAGRLMLAYGIFGSYAFQQAATDKDFGIAIASDYTLLASRVAVIPTSARNQDAAKTFLTYLLSREGQQLVASQGMIPVRIDLPSPYPQLSGIRTRAIIVGPALLANRDQLNTANFMRRWNAALRPD